MKILLQGKEHSDSFIQAIYCTLVAYHDVVYKEIVSIEDVHNFNMIVLTGFSENNQKISEKMMIHNKPCFIMDAGYLQRGEYRQFGLYRLNWLYPFEVKKDRWEAVKPKIPPLTKFRNNNDYILVCGQMPQDAQHGMSVEELEQYYIRLIKRIRKQSNRKIAFRPHPGYKTISAFFRHRADARLVGTIQDSFDIILDPDESIDTQLRECWCMISLNSGSGIEALINRTPVFCDIDSVSLDIRKRPLYYGNCYTDLRDLYDGSIWESSSREKINSFFNRLAYSQWKETEIHEMFYTYKFIFNERNICGEEF